MSDPKRTKVSGETNGVCDKRLRDDKLMRRGLVFSFEVTGYSKFERLVALVYEVQADCLRKASDRLWLNCYCNREDFSRRKILGVRRLLGFA